MIMVHNFGLLFRLAGRDLSKRCTVCHLVMRKALTAGNIGVCKTGNTGAVHSAHNHGSVRANVNCSPCSGLIVIVLKMPVLHKPNSKAQLDYVLYRLNRSSGAELHCQAFSDSASRFVAKLRIVLHKLLVRYSSSLLHDLQLILRESNELHSKLRFTRYFQS